MLDFQKRRRPEAAARGDGRAPGPLPTARPGDLRHVRNRGLAEPGDGRLRVRRDGLAISRGVRAQTGHVDAGRGGARGRGRARRGGGRQEEETAEEEGAAGGARRGVARVDASNAATKAHPRAPLRPGQRPIRRGRRDVQLGPEAPDRGGAAARLRGRGGEARQVGAQVRRPSAEYRWFWERRRHDGVHDGHAQNDDDALRRTEPA
mmetsp:Transcript_17609/g.54135  ORF Transcript_17609/g.54135 Transcript_17609/m.54135 type:complete len:206 (+) Transcript_17609:1005-1622(+)